MYIHILCIILLQILQIIIHPPTFIVCFLKFRLEALHQVIHPMHMKTSIRGLLIQQAKPVSPKEPVFTRSSLIKWVSCLPKSIQKASKGLSFVNSII